MSNLIVVEGCQNYSKLPSGAAKRMEKMLCIVIHYTAGSLQSTINWFLNPTSQVSSHLVIDRDGTIYKLFPWHYIAWHAGVSTWRGQQWVNRFGYGIELVSTSEQGFTFTKEQYNSLRDWLWGGTFTDENGIVETQKGLAIEHGLTDRDIGRPDAQILGHEHISQGRKIDPGPNFDWSLIAKPVTPIELQIVVKQQPSEVAEQSQQVTEQKLSIWWSGILKKVAKLISGFSGKFLIKEI